MSIEQRPEQISCTNSNIKNTLAENIIVDSDGQISPDFTPASGIQHSSSAKQNNYNFLESDQKTDDAWMIKPFKNSFSGYNLQVK